MKFDALHAVGLGRRRWDSNPRELFTLHDFQSCSLGHYETPPQQRREWDSNPRGLFTLPLFESGTFDHSDISPGGSIAYLDVYDKAHILGTLTESGLARSWIPATPVRFVASVTYTTITLTLSSPPPSRAAWISPLVV